jgi:hypothetical protein
MMASNENSASSKTVVDGKLIQFGCVVLGAFLALVVNFLWEAHTGQQRHLSYYVTTSTLSAPNLRFAVGDPSQPPDKYLNALTIVRVDVLDRSDKDFASATVLLKFPLKPRADGKGYEPEHFSHTAYGQPGKLAIVPSKFFMEDGALYAQYDLTQVNRSGSAPVLSATFVFSAYANPRVEVSVGGGGNGLAVEATPGVVEPAGSSATNLPCWGWSIVPVLLIVGIWCFYKVSKRRQAQETATSAERSPTLSASERSIPSGPT